MRYVILDVESDALLLESTILWTVCLKSQDTELTVNPFLIGKDEAKKQILDFIFIDEEIPVIVGHNYLGFDCWALWKFLDISCQYNSTEALLDEKTVYYFDTYYSSMFLKPDRKWNNKTNHSLSGWGKRIKTEEKIEYRKYLIETGLLDKTSPKGAEFGFHTEYMDIYCMQDCYVCEQVFLQLYAELQTQNTLVQFNRGQLSFFLMKAQELTGIKFDIDRAKKLRRAVKVKIDEIKDKLEADFPTRKPKKAEEKDFRIPKITHKKNGEFSSLLMKFFEKIDAELIDSEHFEFRDKIYKIEPELIIPVEYAMKIEDTQAIREYFLDIGWEPTIFNYKKDKAGKPIRDESNNFIWTTPKMHDNGKICPNLLKLSGEIPKSYIRYLSYRNRYSVIKGWLANSRLAIDGRLSTSSSGIAASHRQKHSTVVNVPKAADNVIFGKEMRSLFCVDEGMVMIGCDQSALEARVCGHWTYKYDDGKTSDVLLHGDVHCFSEDAEILTDNGWKTFGELSYSDKVAQWSNGEITFVVPSDIIWGDYDGEMIKLANKNLSMSVTPDHRVLLKDFRTGKYQNVLAKNLSIKNSNSRIPSSGVYHPTIPRILTDSQIKLIVATQADGSFTNKINKSIRFSFVRKNKVNRLIEILKDCGIEYSQSVQHRKGRDEIRFYISYKNINFNLFEYIDSTTKSFMINLIELPYEKKLIFINELALWDGTITKNEDIVLDTTDSVSVQICQIVCSVSNIRTSVRRYEKSGHYGDCIIHRLYVSLKSLPHYCTLKSKLDIVNYSGKIGCVTVPSGYIMVKQNNSVFISGNSTNAKAFFPQETKNFDIDSPTFDKDDPGFKPWRSKSKNGTYAIQYGASPKKVASTLGKPESEGKRLYDAYWEANSALKQLKDNLEKFWLANGKSYIPTIDKRLLPTRSKHSLINLLFQSTGAIIVDEALILFHEMMGGKFELDELSRPFYRYKNYVVKRTVYYHDEFGVECNEEIGEELKTIMEDVMRIAGENLQLRVPLAGEAKIGFNWRDVH